MAGLSHFFVFSILLSTIKASTPLETISFGQYIKDGETLVSNGQSFELGFFSPGSSSNRYLGIWYKKVSTGTVVWVANRETPILDTSGILNFTTKGILALVNGTGGVVWSSDVGTTRIAKHPLAQLLESGNFVIRDGNEANSENYLWQSFDYPGDTNLPGMKLGRNFVTGRDWSITSWKSLDNPAKGEYTFSIDPNGYPQPIFRKGNATQLRAGCWIGNRFTGSPRIKPNPVYRYELVINEREIYYKIEQINKSVLSRVVVNASGVAERLTWIDKTHGWSRFFALGADQCDNYNMCGANARCSMNDLPSCDCLEGFKPKSSIEWSFNDWSAGCVRRDSLDCDEGEGFVKHAGLKLPDTSGSWYNTSLSLEECKGLCLKNCSCMAFANADVRYGGSGCVLWFGDLLDMRIYPYPGQDLYVRMTASYIENIKRKREFAKEKRIGLIILSMVLVLGVLALGCIFYIQKRKLKNREKLKTMLERDYNSLSQTEDLELPAFDLTTVMEATNHFAVDNKLGEGGFGPVYKGALCDGQEIAVKRLSFSSGQGLEELENEVQLIAKLQHRNLVKLLGYCIQGDEQMLIYEYMPNKSLDYFIFDPSRRKLLDWQKRINIIVGIARGLLYLHQDSRLRIIHRDLKTSNVLLDADMNPKISDFGMARIFGVDQIEANTTRVVGTYGYMAPEYAADGLFSVKSDIFSFGVIVLEMVSGRRNRGFFSHQHHHNLVGHAWRLWMGGMVAEIVDETLGETCELSEISRCIHIGLLCVQQQPEDRPNMSTVLLMLFSESLLPQPKQPGFFAERNLPRKSESSSSNYKSTSTNEISVSVLEPR